MRERPILFAGPMVRAILSGEKTVTRRVMKPQPTPSNMGGHSWPCPIHQTMLHVEQELQNGEGIWAGLADSACPHGTPGDRLWVRETWATDAQVDSIAPRELSQGEPIWYPADDHLRQTGCSMMSRGKCRPSIHMPRWASRILLEITAVRVERLQDISDEQALSEGVDQTNTSIPGYARQRFQDLWESINGTGSWDANPWVWVVEFKRITP
ncbi:hypothetical protein [Pseudomonas otitidis]|uniref:hypothetical protein n=1 Tax=Metapseudomonas otitidis TaxID=319939 RepID=UPI00244C5C89|nr:hypothetical protein [Pseudomonas otitidis]MDG9784684.1 hypothetical protein [Pseudomonas otitidis]